jgi:hypothetical protein
MTHQQAKKEIRKMDLKKMSVAELKALGYDEMKRLEQSQRNIQIIESQIALKQKEEKENADTNSKKSKK